MLYILILGKTMLKKYLGHGPIEKKGLKSSAFSCCAARILAPLFFAFLTISPQKVYEKTLDQGGKV
jgi:hypothetical protein